MSPVPYTWGPFLAKIFLKIDEIKIRPLTPPQNHFNTLPVLVADACIQEGWEKSEFNGKGAAPFPFPIPRTLLKDMTGCTGGGGHPTMQSYIHSRFTSKQIT